MYLKNLGSKKGYFYKYKDGIYQPSNKLVENSNNTGINTNGWEEVNCNYFYECVWYGWTNESGCETGFMVSYSKDYCMLPYFSSGYCWVDWQLVGENSTRECEYVYYPDPPPPPSGGDNGSGTGSGNDNSSISDQDIVNAQPVQNDVVPINPELFKNCFDDGKTASSYKLTLYIDQPEAGSNAQWTLNTG